MVTLSVTHGSESRKPGSRRTTRSSHESSPLPTMDASDADEKVFEMDASWNSVSGPTDSRVVRLYPETAEVDDGVVFNGYSDNLATNLHL